MTKTFSLIATFVIGLSILSTTEAFAEDKSALLLDPTDLKRGAAAGTQGVVGDDSGAVHYPDEILAFAVSQTDDNKDLIESWKTTHKFFVIPINIGISPSTGKIPERLSLTLTFAGVGSLARQPIIIDCFPKTGFTPGAVSASLDLKLDGDLKFAPRPEASVDANAKGALSVKYSPNFANVVSGNGSGSAFWQFSRTQDKYPIGELPLRLVVAVPNPAVASGLGLTADLRLDLTGPWWTHGTTIASFRSHVSFPQ